MDDKATSWVEANTYRIREMFDLFDKDKSETVVNEEVSRRKRNKRRFEGIVTCRSEQS